MKKLHYILLTVLCVMAASCSSKRGGVTSSGGVALPKGVEQKFDNMVATYGEWDKISVPVRMQMKSPVSISFSGRAYMERDKAVYMSLKFIGMEVAVLYATPDSVYCVDKVHKMAVVESLAKITEATGITFGQIQSLMLGRAFVPGSETALSRKSKNITLVGESEDGWCIVTRSGGKMDYTCKFDVDNATGQVSQLSVSVPSGQSVTCDYRDWAECAIGELPKTLSTDMTIGGKRLDASLNYTPSSLQRGSDVTVPTFKRPDRGYRVISAADLMTTLKDML